MNAVVFLIHVVLISSVCWLLWRKQAEFRTTFATALAFKLAAGIGVGLLYMHYYDGGDTWVYFEDARQLTAVAQDDFPAYVKLIGSTDYLPGAIFDLHEPRALFLVKIVSVFGLITSDNYWLISVYFSLLSFLGAWFLFRELTVSIPTSRISAAIAFLFFPSLVFWTSGVIKESLAMGSLYFVAAVCLRAWFGKRVPVPLIVASVVALWVAWNLKYYFAAVFVATAAAVLAFHFTQRRGFLDRSFLTEAATFVLFLVVLLSVASLFHPNFSPNRLLSVIIENNAAFMSMSSPEDRFSFHDLEPTFVSLAVNSPWALISGLFRPFLWETTNVLQVFAGVENLAILLTALVAAGGALKFPNSEHRMLIFATLTYVLILAVFIAISTPNFGTLSRYRVGYLPFFIMVIASNRTVQRSIDRLVR